MTNNPDGLSDARALLPCPFCGGEAKRFTIEEEDENFGGDVIACTGVCGASSHVEFGRKENLVSLWNTRTPPASTSTAIAAGEVERVAKALGLYRYPGGKGGDRPTRWPTGPDDVELRTSDNTVPLTWDFAEQCRAEARVMLAAVAPKAASEDGATGLLREAADYLDHYARFIREDVKADDLERHPYLPALEQTAADLRAALAASPTDATGAEKMRDRCAAYIEGKGGVVPGATVFIPVITGDRMPTMSGDGRDSLNPHKRRCFDDATRDLATAIRNLPVAGETL